MNSDCMKLMRSLGENRYRAPSFLMIEPSQSPPEPATPARSCVAKQRLETQGNGQGGMSESRIVDARILLLSSSRRGPSARHRYSRVDRKSTRLNSSHLGI